METKNKLSFGEQLSGLELQAVTHVKKFMSDKDSFNFLTQEQIDDCEFDNTIGIAFHNRHGFDDYGHIIKIYKNNEHGGELWIEGHGYEMGQMLSMALSDVESGSIIWVADILLNF